MTAARSGYERKHLLELILEAETNPNAFIL
jgi:hypothetical protein